MGINGRMGDQGLESCGFKNPPRARTGPALTTDLNETALLVIDIQNYCKPGFPGSCFESTTNEYYLEVFPKVVTATQRLLEACRRTGKIEVIHTTIESLT